MITAIAPPVSQSVGACVISDTTAHRYSHMISPVQWCMMDIRDHGTHLWKTWDSWDISNRPPAGYSTAKHVVPSAPAVPRIGTPSFFTTKKKKTGARHSSSPRPIFHFSSGVGFQTSGRWGRHAARPDAPNEGAAGSDVQGEELPRAEFKNDDGIYFDRGTAHSIIFTFLVPRGSSSRDCTVRMYASSILTEGDICCTCHAPRKSDISDLLLSRNRFGKHARARATDTIYRYPTGVW